MHHLQGWILAQLSRHQRRLSSSLALPTTPWSVCVLVMCCASPAAISGCGHSALPPPVSVTFRDSVFGIGKVAQISNKSAHHLYNVKVTGRNFEKIQSGSVRATGDLAPGSYVEVGWAEFGGWVPQPGETIEVYADDYLVPTVSIVPK